MGDCYSAFKLSALLIFLAAARPTKDGAYRFKEYRIKGA